jgi:hypothetical protein
MCHECLCKGVHETEPLDEEFLLGQGQIEKIYGILIECQGVIIDLYEWFFLYLLWDRQRDIVKVNTLSVIVAFLEG